MAGKKVRCKCEALFRVPDERDNGKSTFDLGDGAEPGAPDTQATKSCPSCAADIAANAVLCIHCGYNLETGKGMGTEVGFATKTAHKPARVYTGRADGFFGKLSRSWQFAKIAYGILWDFKQLVIFPIFSAAAALVVAASFLLPVWSTGTMSQFTALLDNDSNGPVEAGPLVWVFVFLFYLCNYFVIAFFNTALAACAMKVCAGDAPTIGFGLRIAAKRLPQILGWAVVSATVGLVLKMIENANDKVGAIIAAVLGTGWTVLTYFVVPVLAVEGVGPIKAVKQSFDTLRQMWGEAVLGNFSMGLLAFLITLPIYLALIAALVFSISAGQTILVVTCVVLLVLVAILAAAVSSAADVVFRGLLYNYATGRTIPEEVDDQIFAAAFATSAK